MVKDVGPEDVKKAASETKLLFVDTWAPWCGPCKALTPILEELDEKYADDTEVGFVKINTEEHMAFAMEHNIAAIPCVLIYFDGKLGSFELPDPRSGENKTTDRLIGLRPIEHYEQVIEQLL